MGSLTVAVTNLRKSRTLAISTVVALETYKTSLFRIWKVVAWKYAAGSRKLTLYIIGIIGPSNREQSTPNCSATARVSPRYKKTDAGSARACVNPFAFATASARDTRQASKLYCPCAPVRPPTAPNATNVCGSRYKYIVSSGCTYTLFDGSYTSAPNGTASRRPRRSSITQVSNP